MQASQFQRKTTDEQSQSLAPFADAEEYYYPFPYLYDDTWKQPSKAGRQELLLAIDARVAGRGPEEEQHS